MDLMRLLSMSLILSMSLLVACGDEAEDPKTNNANTTNNKNNANNSSCTTTVDFYNAEVKANFMQCTTCHNSAGIAAGSRFVLNRDDLNDQTSRGAIKAMALEQSGDSSLLLVKATGGMGHGGGPQWGMDSEQVKKAQQLVDRLKTPVACDAGAPF